MGRSDISCGPWLTCRNVHLPFSFPHKMRRPLQNYCQLTCAILERLIGSFSHLFPVHWSSNQRLMLPKTCSIFILLLTHQLIIPFRRT